MDGDRWVNAHLCFRGLYVFGWRKSTIIVSHIFPDHLLNLFLHVLRHYTDLHANRLELLFQVFGCFLQLSVCQLYVFGFGLALSQRLLPLGRRCFVLTNN